jgi:hypothetical protein
MHDCPAVLKSCLTDVFKDLPTWEDSHREWVLSQRRRGLKARLAWRFGLLVNPCITRCRRRIDERKAIDENHFIFEMYGIEPYRDWNGKRRWDIPG